MGQGFWSFAPPNAHPDALQDAKTIVAHRFGMFFGIALFVCFCFVFEEASRVDFLIFYNTDSTFEIVGHFLGKGWT